MLKIFGRKKSSKVVVKTPIQKINEAALALVSSANEGHRGARLVTNGAALEIVRRSLVKTKDKAFSVQKMHALKEVSEYIALAQRNKVVTASAAHFDLLPIGHPSSDRKHSMPKNEVLKARARWFADDSRVVDDNVSSLLATAFISDPESPEHQYAVARLTAMGAHRVPVEALVAAALGFNDGANKGFWRRQLRDRKGQFARMGGSLRTLLRRGGQVFPQYSEVVSTNENDNTFRSMLPDGRIIESDANSVDSEVIAILPGEQAPDGVGTSPAKYDSSDPVVNEEDLKFVEEPHGFNRASAPFSPRGIDPENFDRVWEDDLGNYQVIKTRGRDGEIPKWVVSRLEQDQIVPIGVGENWSDVVSIIDVDEPNFSEGRDAEPNIPEQFDIGPAPRETLDLNELTPDELAAGYGWFKAADGSYEGQGSQGNAYDIDQLPNGQWLLSERIGDGGEVREIGPFETAAEAFENGQIEIDGPEFDEGAVIDFREGQGPDEAPEPEPTEPTEPSGFYQVDRGPYTPQGPAEGVESDNYTDDPVELAQNYDPEELEGALEEAVRNGEGEALLPFDEGDEYVPAEALYNALKEQDRDPDRLLDELYGQADEAPEIIETQPGGIADEEELQPVTPEEVAELRAEEDLPALLDALSNEELADVVNNADYRAYLPENPEFDVPENMYDIDPRAVDPNVALAPENAPDGAPNSPYDMAMDMSPEDLESGLRGAVQADDSDRLGYYPISVFDEDGEEFIYDVPAEAWRDALQLQGIDANEILAEAYQGEELEPEEVDDALEEEGIDTEEVFNLDQETKDRLIAATKEGGYTVDFVTGEVPTDGYMVASEADVPDGEGGLKKREEVVSLEDFEADPEKYVDEFVARNVDKLTQDGYYIGTWTSTETDEETGEEKEYVFFDVSERIEDKEEALQAARDRNEIAIFGIAEFEEFFTDPEREAQKNAEQQATEGDDAAPEELPGDDGAGAPGVDEAGQPVDSGEPEEQEEVGPLGRVYDISDWEEVGGQAGSNAGGLYRDPEGNEYYVKFPPQKQLRNELLASALYEAAGVPVGRVYLGRDADGREVLVSPMLQNAEPLRDYLDDPNVMEEAAYYFPVDAWLNNWDAVGLVFDNMVVADDAEVGTGRRLFRIDAGGSLLFRAQGGDKELPEDVQLIDSLRNPDINQQAATVYGDLTDEEIRGALQRMLFGTDDETIDTLVDAAFPDDAETSNLLKERLKSRREYLIERFDPVTPEQLDRMAEGEEQDFVEQLEEARQSVDEVFADNPIVIDFDGDIQAQIDDAIENQRDLVFAYNGTDRVVRPIMIETNENTGNTNITAVDGEGNIKKFTISKMSAAENSGDIVGEVTGDDIEGEEIETSDAQVPEGLLEWEQDLLKVIDEMYSTPNLTSQDVENLGEQPDVNDDITSDFVSKIDAYDADAPEVATPEQKVMADAVEQLINPDDEADAPSSEQILESVSDPANTEPDLIWQRVQDEYEGQVLDNGHIVVSSTMHGDRRYDVVVRRANNNTFHIYHRVTFPDGSTKVKEMGGQGWHSAEALFSRVETQIFNSRTRPKTTVNKGLKPENNNTLYADTSTPTQPGSYVSADGSVVKQGDRITVVNPTHSKFGMGARIISVKRKYSSDGKKYTDYLRVKYDDGTKNNIVSTSVVPEGSSAPAATPATTSASSPNVKAATVSSGESLTLDEAKLLPQGAVVKSSDGRFYEHLSGNAWSDISNGFGMVFSPQETFIYVAPSKQEALDEVAPEVDNPLDKDALPAPSNWTQADTNANGGAIDEFTLPERDLDVDTRIYSFGQDFTSQKFIDQYGFEGRVKVEGGLQKYYTDQKKKFKIPSVGISPILPGSVVETKPEMGSKTKYLVDDVDFETGKFSVVALTGPDKTKRFVDMTEDDFVLTTKFIPAFEADTRFGVEISTKSLGEIRAAKAYSDNPGIYSNPDMVRGAGVEEPELESLPDWGQAPGDTTSTKDALSRIRQWASLGDTREASQGIYTLMDATSIEDGQVRIQRVIDEDGSARIRISGKFTNWFGREKFVPRVTSGEVDAVESSGIEFDFYEKTDQGLVYSASSVGGIRVDESKTGATFTYTTPQGYRVKVHRALTSAENARLNPNEDEVDFFTSHGSGNDRNVSLHNMFDVLLPDNASSADIEQALQEMGITQARPATDLDVRAIMENKLIALFGKKRDGSKNLTGPLREQELQKIQQQYGITADDLILENDGTTKSKPTILISESAARRIADEAGVMHFYHRIYMNDLSDSDIDSIAGRVVDIFEDGSIQSTTSRLLTGGGEGLSSSDDLLRPGADYTFTYMVTDNNKNSSGHWSVDPLMNKYVTVIMDPVQMLRRIDFYANEGDSWGMMQNKMFDSLSAMKNGAQDAEALFKTDIPINAIKAMSVTPELRRRILEVLAERGIDFINGNDVEQMMNAAVSDWDWR